MKKTNFLYFIAILIIACSRPDKVITVNELADSYYARFLSQFPEMTYSYGVETKKHDELASNSLMDIRQWENYEDSLHQLLRKIDIDGELLSQIEQITYWTLKEALESSIGIRQCSLALWANLNHINGLHQQLTRLAEVQPVGTEDLRVQAIKRWEKVPDKINSEISNLRLGLSHGYSMPKVIVKLVIDQLNTLLQNAIEESPFMSPALRDGDTLFIANWQQLIEQKLNPAIGVYRDFLKTEYLPVARDNVSILAIPNGDKCYEAFIRWYTTLSISPDEIFERGTTLVSANAAKAKEVGGSLYSVNDLESVINRIQKDTTNYFKTEKQLLDFSNRKLTQSKKKSSSWFATLPSKDVILKPALEHEAQTDRYVRANGPDPAYYVIGLKNPEKKLKGIAEITAFHEGYPGHHVQSGIAQDITGLHPITTITSNSGFNEGWARYSEQLAEEMGLYEDQNSLILRLAWPGRGMVIDPGIHKRNWSAEEVTVFCKEAGFVERGMPAYYRSIISPGQLTAYDLGGEEFKALRKMAENELKEVFNIREFHSKVLENGSIPLSMLRRNIEKWIESKSLKD
jgi:uncharacterized protein (DUF885 family)